MDLRIVKTYRALHDAFSQLMNEKHFEDFTVNELCDRATIRRATFYKHFDDKYAYFRHYVSEIWEEAEASVPKRSRLGAGREPYLAITAALIRYLNDNLALVGNLRSSSLFPMLLSILSEMLRAELRSEYEKKPFKSLPDGVDIDSVAAFYAGGIIGLLLAKTADGQPIDEEAFLDSLSALRPNF